MKKRLFIITCCLAFSAALIFGLQSISGNTLPSSSILIERNTSTPLKPYKRKLGLKYSYSFAGVTQSNIVLSNSMTPNYLLITDFALSDTHTIKIAVPEAKKMAWTYMTASIDSPSVILAEGIFPTFLIGDLSSQKVLAQEIKDSIHFDKWFPLSDSSFIIRSYDTSLHQNVLIKIKLNNNKKPIRKYILEKQIDGFFCTDGTFTFDKIQNKLFYVYYYRNQFLCLDTNLNLIYKGNTIDTNSTAKFKVGEIKSTKQFTISTPPLIVNKAACMFKNYLFIQSALTAKHEDKDLASTSSIIDVYNIVNGKYKLSFYIPKFAEEKMRSFRVYNSSVFAIYDHYIVSYPLTLEYSN